MGDIKRPRSIRAKTVRVDQRDQGSAVEKNAKASNHRPHLAIKILDEEKFVGMTKNCMLLVASPMTI